MAESGKRLGDAAGYYTQHYTNTYPATGTSTYYSAVNRNTTKSTTSYTSVTSTTSHSPSSAQSGHKTHTVGSLTYRSSVSGVSDLKSVRVNRSTSEYWHGSKLNHQVTRTSADSNTEPPGGHRAASVGLQQGDTSGSRGAVSSEIPRKTRSPLTSREYRDNVSHNRETDGRHNTRGDPNKCHHHYEINHAAHVDSSYRASRQQMDDRLTTDDHKTRGSPVNGTATTTTTTNNNTTAAPSTCSQKATSHVNSSPNSDRNHNRPASVVRDLAASVLLSEHGDKEASRIQENIEGLKNTSHGSSKAGLVQESPHAEYSATGQRVVVTSIVSRDDTNKQERSTPVEGPSSPATDDRKSEWCEGTRAENQSSSSRLETHTNRASVMASEGKRPTEAASSVYETFTTAPTTTTSSRRRRRSPPPPPTPQQPPAPPIPPHRYNGHSQINKESMPLPTSQIQIRAATGQNGISDRKMNHTQANSTNYSSHTTDSEYSCNTETSSVMSDSLDSDRSSVVTDSGYREFFQQKFHMSENSSAEGQQDGDGRLSSSPTSLEHPLLISQRNILNPEAEKITKIISNRGTIRGLKNLVKAGIATYAERQDRHKNYRLIEAGKVVVYTTSVKIIRETHDRCLKVKKILQTHMIKYEERDIFMSRKNHDELRERLGSDHKEVPQIFADGQHIGGLEELEALNESGELRRVFKQFRRVSHHTACKKCGGYQYIPCAICHGSKKSQNRNYFTEEFSALRCTHCDENGLIKCDMCTDGEIAAS